jgi:hypothetical protein
MIRGKRQVLNQLMLGQTLHKQFVLLKDGTPDGTIYFLLPSTTRVDPAPALEVIGSEDLMPMNDGLFGPETSQSWRIRC